MNTLPSCRPDSCPPTGIEVLHIPAELQQYHLLWDIGDGYASTYCKSKKLSYLVCGILKSYNLPAHRMTTDERIVVIYF